MWRGCLSPAFTLFRSRNRNLHRTLNYATCQCEGV
ncbi:MAG: hypothetical protein EOP84_24610 [Verrucomicrobiaceae bacterium]|nr:MAG: hypothetical protein EOP84_24610 [Verrucomicrobiaceae bacterium]